MKIKDEVADVLSDSIINDNKLYLPDKQLDRKLYVDVNKVLIAIGGKWNRKAKAHIFDDPPEEIIDQILLLGEYIDKKKELQFFETPSELAQRLMEMANIKVGETILEPSAGKGAIAKFIPDCDCIELDEQNLSLIHI